LSGSLLIRAAEETGLRAISEVFADRSYEADGSLVSRRKPGAIISDEREALRRVIRMVKEGKVNAINGEEIAIRAESICVHGDGEKALLFAKSIREALTANDIQVSPG
ncbi:MAG: LamB/YcsF family protein, partial [Clostridia bacterium]|nr:LamB/YcsF family protein [Clostridia bacterium]